MSYNPDSELAGFAQEGARLLFYPSSGYNPGRIIDMDYDVFVFADYLLRDKLSREEFSTALIYGLGNISLHADTPKTRVFRKGKKWLFMFFQDNNDVLERIRSSGNRIACFIGINDGCCEGGNYECVNTSFLLHKVLPIMAPEGMLYITDHSSVLWKSSVYPWDLSSYQELGLWEEYIWKDRYFKLASPRSEFYGLMPFLTDTIVEYHVSIHQPEVYEYSGPSVRLTIEHANIVIHLDELNGALISNRYRYLQDRNVNNSAELVYVDRYFFKPYPIEPVMTGAERSLKLLLNMANILRWEVVGTTAFGEGRHEHVLKVIEEWREEYPKWIRIFHFDTGDFSDILDEMVLTSPVQS